MIGAGSVMVVVTVGTGGGEAVTVAVAVIAGLAGNVTVRTGAAVWALYTGAAAAGAAAVTVVVVTGTAAAAGAVTAAAAGAAAGAGAAATVVVFTPAAALAVFTVAGFTVLTGAAAGATFATGVVSGGPPPGTVTAGMALGAFAGLPVTPGTGVSGDGDDKPPRFGGGVTFSDVASDPDPPCPPVNRASNTAPSVRATPDMRSPLWWRRAKSVTWLKSVFTL